MHNVGEVKENAEIQVYRLSFRVPESVKIILFLQQLTPLMFLLMSFCRVQSKYLQKHVCGPPSKENGNILTSVCQVRDSAKDVVILRFKSFFLYQIVCIIPAKRLVQTGCTKLRTNSRRHSKKTDRSLKKYYI